MIWYEAEVGSRAWGLNVEGSDRDLFKVTDETQFPKRRGVHDLLYTPERALEQFTAVRASVLWLPAMFPSKPATGPAAEFIRQHREELVRSTKSRYYLPSMRFANNQFCYAERVYPVFPKHLAYSTLIYFIIWQYAERGEMGQVMPLAEQFRSWLLAVRKRELPFSEVLARNLELREKAAEAGSWWTSGDDPARTEAIIAGLRNIFASGGKEET